jgi:hypothetical protein
MFKNIMKKLSFSTCLTLGFITLTSLGSESLMLMSDIKIKLALIKSSDVVAFLMGAYQGAPETLPGAAVATVTTGMLGGLANALSGIAHNLAKQGLTNGQRISDAQTMSYLQYFGRTAVAYAMGTIAGHIWQTSPLAAIRKIIAHEIMKSLTFLTNIMPSGEAITVATMLAGGILLYRSGQ